MAKTTRTYTSNGIQTNYPVDFTLGFINRDYVYVYLVGDTYTTQLDYTWLSDSLIQLNDVPADGTDFIIRRVVPDGSLVNEYTDGAMLRKENLDDSYSQPLMLLEEIEDFNASEIADVNSRVDDVETVKMDKVPAATTDNVVIFDSAGNAKDSGKKLNEVGNGGSYIGENPPTFPQQGDRWTRCTDMKGFIYYIDADGAQWVEDRPSYGEDTIGDVSVPYIFDTVALFKASLIEFPDGKTIHLNDRDADFKVIPSASLTDELTEIENANTSQFITIIGTATTLKTSQAGIESGDTADIGLQNLINDSMIQNIVIDSEVDIYSEITIARSLTISFIGEGKFNNKADIDFMIRQTEGTVTLNGWNADDTTVYVGRTQLHRGYRAEGSTTKTIFNALTRSKGFNTQIHANQTNLLSVGKYQLTNVYGTEPQEGYGLESSAKFTFIGDGSVDNTEITNAHGRHAIYINADFKYVSIGTLYCKNFNRNPIQINPDALLEARVVIGKQTYEAVQVAPVSNRAGAINLTVEDSSSKTDVTVEINGLFVDGYDGCLVSCPFGGYPNSVIKNVRGRNNRELVDETTFNAIHLANMVAPIVDDIKVDELVNNSVAVVRCLSGTTMPRISNVSTGSQTGRSVVAVSDTTDYVIDAVDSFGTTPLDRLDVINASTGKMTTNYNTDYVTIGNTDLTPNVRNLQKILYSTGSPIIVIDFENGENGQELFVFASQGNVTIAAGSTIDTDSGGDIVLGNREIAHFVKQGSRWVEVGY